jgi:hypothetical protein
MGPDLQCQVCLDPDLLPWRSLIRLSTLLMLFLLLAAVMVVIDAEAMNATLHSIKYAKKNEPYLE